MIALVCRQPVRPGRPVSDATRSDG